MKYIKQNPKARECAKNRSAYLIGAWFFRNRFFILAKDRTILLEDKVVNLLIA
jgi:hypothetical protein